MSDACSVCCFLVNFLSIHAYVAASPIPIKRLFTKFVMMTQWMNWTFERIIFGVLMTEITWEVIETGSSYAISVGISVKTQK